MSYDSASDTALAAQAYQRALAIAQQNRTRLNTQFGLRGDAGHEGEMDNTAAGQLGSIYQGNLQSVEAEEGAVASDRRRGFTGGGLGAKAQASAHRIALNRQAGMFSDATSNLGANTQEQELAGQDYEAQKANIGNRSAFDLAQTLASNPVLGSPPLPAAAATAPANNPVQIKQGIATLKKKPAPVTLAQALKNAGW